MLSKLFLGISLAGAEWVLYLLMVISITSVALIFERFLFYRDASRGLKDFRAQLRALVQKNQWEDAATLARARAALQSGRNPDLEAEMSLLLLSHPRSEGGRSGSEILGEIAKDPVFRARKAWDQNLSLLATIGSNAPFVGLFGTVLGIIKAFNDLSMSQVTSAPQAVTSGISEALVATAFGILVAIPAVVAFNLFQKRVRSALLEADALRSFLIGKLASKKGE